MDDPLAQSQFFTTVFNNYFLDLRRNDDILLVPHF